MTTREDWIFRSEYLKAQAAGLRKRVTLNLQEADRLEQLAVVCSDASVKQKD